jgi:hypothetical protein
MKSQCEALVTGKQQKMSILHSFKPQAEAKVFPIEEEKKDTSVYDVVSLFTLQIQTMLNELIPFCLVLSLCKNTVASVLRFGGSDIKIETVTKNSNTKKNSNSNANI